MIQVVFGFLTKLLSFENEILIIFLYIFVNFYNNYIKNHTINNCVQK